jgi:predicted tellurium resistance membrane protein TerC
MVELLSDPQTYLSLLALTALEIVLGIDNILFISIVTSRLPQNKQRLARRLGLSFALIGRLGLLFSLSWVMSLTKPLFTVLSKDFSGRDLVLGLGGLFLIYKATQEIFFHLEEVNEKNPAKKGKITLGGAIFQIIILDIVFSLDSIITAIGLASHLPVMALAILIAVLIMILCSEHVSDFLNKHPSMKILGLAFLLMVAVLLVADCFGHHIPRGYVYFALGFSLLCEWINIEHKKRSMKAQNKKPD